MLFLYSCLDEDKIDNPENYELTEIHLYKDDCSIYQMRFYDGDYIFRFAQSGTCPNLKGEDYISDYKKYLLKYSDNLVNKRGLITFEYYPFKDSNNLLVDSIISISKCYFKTYVSLTDISDNDFTIKVFDKN